MRAGGYGHADTAERMALNIVKDPAGQDSSPASITAMLTDHAPDELFLPPAYGETKISMPKASFGPINDHMLLEPKQPPESVFLSLLFKFILLL